MGSFAETADVDPALARLVNVIVAELEPVAIWLFGSRAEGRARPNSDYDVLVVLPDDAPAHRLDMARAWWLGDKADVAADIVPCTVTDFEEEKDVLDTLPRAAWLKGRRIYER